MASGAHRGGKSDEVFETIRSEIMNGIILPGARLLEQEIADRLKVSRTPVREGFARLVQAGLLVPGGSGRGHLVTTPTSADVLDAYSVREALEGLAASLAAKRCGVGDAIILRELQRQLDAEMDAGNIESAVDLTLTLHSTIWRMSGNELLVTVMNDLMSVWSRLNPTTYSAEDRRGQSTSEHRDLIEAIIAGDVVLAEQVAREHIVQARDARLKLSLNPMRR